MNQVIYTNGKEKERQGLVQNQKDILTSFTLCLVNKHRDMQTLTLTVSHRAGAGKNNSMANLPAWPSTTAQICSWRTGRTIAEPAKWATLSSA